MMNIGKKNDLALLSIKQSTNNIYVVMEIMKSKIKNLNEKKKENYGYFYFDEHRYTDIFETIYNNTEKLTRFNNNIEGEIVEDIFNLITFENEPVIKYIELYESNKLNDEIVEILGELCELISHVAKHLEKTIISIYELR